MARKRVTPEQRAATRARARAAALARVKAPTAWHGSNNSDAGAGYNPMHYAAHTPPRGPVPTDGRTPAATDPDTLSYKE